MKRELPNVPISSVVNARSSSPTRLRYLQHKRYAVSAARSVDKSFKFPHPLSPSIDHIIPVDKGGHPSDMANL